MFPDALSDRSKVKRLLLLLLLASASLQAQTPICGIIEAPTSLVRSKSPYLVPADIYVPKESRLTIEAGVELLIASTPGPCALDRPDSRWVDHNRDWTDSQFVSIKVDGAFYIEGTPTMPVLIHPESSVPAGRTAWDGIRLESRNRLTTQIQFLHIRGAHRALQATNSSFSVSNSLFDDNNVGIHLSVASTVHIFNNLFTGSRSAGVYQEESSPDIQANIFVGNPGFGIWSDSRRSLRITHNDFWRNAEGDCYHCPASTGRLSQANSRGDSTDKFFNHFADPVFLGSASEKAFLAKDTQVPTDTATVRDTALARMEREGRAAHANLGIVSSKPYVPRGSGAWRLSRYSPLLDQAPENDFFVDDDGTSGDLGMHGGIPNRVRLRYP